MMGRRASLNAGVAFEDHEHHLDFDSRALTTIEKKVPQLKVLVISSPESGHLVPITNVAFELANRKHQVKLVTCAWAAGNLKCKGEKVGCEVVGVAEHVKSADTGEGRAAELKNISEKMIAIFMYYEEEMYGPAKKIAEEWKPDVILGDFVTTSSMRIAKDLAIPLAINMPSPLKIVEVLQKARLFLPILGPLVRLTTPKEEANAQILLARTAGDALSQNLILVNTFFGLDVATSIPANHIITGPTVPRYTTVVTETSMPQLNEWLEWVRQEKLKVVYVTMGSIQKLLPFQITALYKGLDSVPGCAVAWSMKEDQQLLLPDCGKDLPKKFFVNKWFPQAEALNLPDVALVITHCGWGGLNETIIAGKPIVATPFRADQPDNAALVKARGMGEVLNVNKLTESSVQKAVSLVLNNPSYLQKVGQMQKQVLKTGGATRCAEAVEDLAQFGCAELVSEPAPAQAIGKGVVGCGCFCLAAYGLGVLTGLLIPAAAAATAVKTSPAMK